MRFALVTSVLSLSFSAWAAPVAVYDCQQPVDGGAITVQVNEVEPKRFEAQVTIGGSAEGNWDSGVVAVKRYYGTDGRTMLWNNKEKEMTILVHEEAKSDEGKLESIEVTASFRDAETGKTTMFQHARLGCQR